MNGWVSRHFEALVLGITAVAWVGVGVLFVDWDIDGVDWGYALLGLVAVLVVWVWDRATRTHR